MKEKRSRSHFPLLFLGLSFTAFLYSVSAEPKLEPADSIDGQTITLTAPCWVSKDEVSVYVTVKGKELHVPLPKEFQKKFSAGDKAWIGLVGTCKLEPRGVEGLTAESSDSSIVVDRVLFLDQGKDHKRSLEIEEKEKS